MSLSLDNFKQHLDWEFDTFQDVTKEWPEFALSEAINIGRKTSSQGSMLHTIDPNGSEKLDFNFLKIFPIAQSLYNFPGSNGMVVLYTL